MSIEAMKQALEALDIVKIHFTQNRHVNEAITALRTAIEAAEKQVPVAWLHNGKLHEFDPIDWATGTVTPLYPSAQFSKPWVGLTDEERNNLWREVVGWGDPSHDDEDLMKAIEAKLREKNA